MAFGKNPQTQRAARRGSGPLVTGFHLDDDRARSLDLSQPRKQRLDKRLQELREMHEHSSLDSDDVFLG